MNKQKRNRIETSIKCFLISCVLAFGLASTAQAQTSVFINEIHYDNSGTDANEAIEIAGPAGTDLTGWTLVLYNGSNDLVYNTTSLSATLIDDSNGFGFTTITYPTNGIQNGAPDGIALVDNNGTVVQFLSYEGSFTAVDGPASGMTSTDIGVSESSGTSLGFSLQLTGTGSTYEDFTWTGVASSTYSAVNNGQTFLSGPPVTGEVWINEIHYDNASSDVDEAIEVAGEAGIDLSGWSLVLYNGNGGAGYNTTGLFGVIPDDLDGFGFIHVPYPSNGIQNGAPDAVALVDDEGTVIQFLSYEGTLTATDGPASGMTSTDIGVSESGSTPAGNSLQLIGNGTSYADFTWSPDAPNTFGAVNSGQSFSDSIPTTSDVYIHDVQGSGAASPLVGQTVTVEGIVVGDFQATANGFYIQEEDVDADTDPLTSEGIFVFAPGAIDVSVGDLVSVTGAVTEYFDLTEIHNTTNISITSSANALPTISTITLPFASETFPERYEGMYVEFTQELVVSNTYLLGRGGELWLSHSNRLQQPTQVVAPGAPAIAQQALNNLNEIIIDDASTAQNPDPVIFPAPGMDFNNPVRSGYKVTNIKGVLTYAWSGFNLGGNSTNAYRVYVTENPLFNAAPNPRQAQPDDVGGTLKIASFNVLNYFNGDGVGGGFPTSRGADDALEFARQRDKIINAIIAMDADIIGLMEIENDGYGSTSAIQDLVNGLNAVGPVVYDFVDPGVSQIGTDEIAVGFIYNTATVSLAGVTAILDSSVDPTFNDGKNRPSLAQSFTEVTSGQTVTVSVNHLKSKGSDCDALGDPNTGDGQGNCNLTRTSAATAIANWLATDPTGSASPYNIIIGDLNAYAMEDPITAIQNAGYTNLLAHTHGFSAYSYSFDGQWGTLDYALANAALFPLVTGVTSWHINADEAAVLDYNLEFKSVAQHTSFYSTDAHRASDHDPIIVGLALPAQPSSVKFETGTLNSVGSEWQTVSLNNTYESPVVVASVHLVNGISNAPAVTRIQNAGSNSFQIKVQNPSALPLTNYKVTYIVVEEGVYNKTDHGIDMEAVKVNSSKTARQHKWITEARTFAHPYTSPVVVGQVMTYNDPKWSVFWSSERYNRRNPAVVKNFGAGKHVGEDSDVIRADETLGYIAVEAGSGSFGNKFYSAGLSSESVEGIQTDPAGYAQSFTGLTSVETAVISAGAMIGGNGILPVFNGAEAIMNNVLNLSVDEDQIKDTERMHIKERMSYLVIGSN